MAREVRSALHSWAVAVTVIGFVNACSNQKDEGRDSLGPGTQDAFEMADDMADEATGGAGDEKNEGLADPPLPGERGETGDAGLWDPVQVEVGPDPGPVDPDRPCEPRPPLSHHVSFDIRGGFSEEPSGTVDSFLVKAVVTGRKRLDSDGFEDVVEWEFRSQEDERVIVVRTHLPMDYEIPVALGQRVVLFGAKMLGLVGRDLAFVIWEDVTGGALWPVFFLYDASHPGEPLWHQCGGKQPCPVAKMVEPNCAGIPVECGLKVYPPAVLLAHGGVSSGEYAFLNEQGRSSIGYEGYRFAVIRSERYEELVCEGEPVSWLSALIGRSVWVSQCVCRDDADCGSGFWCDTVGVGSLPPPNPSLSAPGRCVEDRCSFAALNQAGKKCKEGFVCDPYRGECWNPATKPLTTCDTDEVCGMDAVCNRRGRLCTGLNECGQTAAFCVQNPCVIMDCPTPCHPLLGQCIECRADCECEKAGMGEWCNGYQCDRCDVSAIGFGQENPGRYEFYEVCAQKGPGDPRVALMEIDPSIYCLPGASGVFAQCDPSKELLCHGDLEFVPGQKWITDDKWGRLCRIVALPWVTKVAGGYYLR